MARPIARPQLEGNVTIGTDRRIGFAEFGDPHGRAMFWLHGTPGARRQIPEEARAFAARNGIRVIGVDRPGIGSSTPHQYLNVAAFARDLETIADVLGVGRFTTIGLSGGGPYALACAAAMPQRVVAVAVIGGVAPTRGPAAIGGGLAALAPYLAPALQVAGLPIGLALSAVIRVVRPLASPAVDLYGRLSPSGDRRLLARPEFKAMFLDDLLNGSRRQMSAPLCDIVVFAREWGFDLQDVTVPVRWWHGDEDHIVPLQHGTHMVAHLPDAQLLTLAGESHLGGLDSARDILREMMRVWDEARAG